MPECCYPDEYGMLFTERSASRFARRFERKGLRGSAGRLAAGVAAAGLDGATILEVGGGVGEIHADLLRRGAARATNVELSAGWEAAADRLLEGMGLRERVRRVVGDFVEKAGDLPAADVVILHRVICCYPDWERMLAAAASRARRVVAVTVPVDRRATRAAIRAGNLLLRLQGREFRAYVHPPEGMIAALRGDGFDMVVDDRGVVWHTFVARRASAPRT